MAKYKHSEICSFCGRELEIAGLKYIPGYNSNICSDCIANGYELMKHEARSQNDFSLGEGGLAKPKEIKEFLGREDIEIPPEKKVSCSIGVAPVSGVKNDEDIAKAIKRADQALYGIKYSTKCDCKLAEKK